MLENRTLLSGAGLPHPTAGTVSELVADIDYANNTGGAFTINLNPGTTFDLYNQLPAVGGGKAVDLTILGNGGTIERAGSERRERSATAAPPDPPTRCTSRPA